MHNLDLRMILQIIGALFCVSNYILIQMRRISATQPLSQVIVGAGGVILLASALLGADWGLILLEVSWLIMVTITLIVRHREAKAAAAAAVSEAEEILTTTAELRLAGLGDSLQA